MSSEFKIVMTAVDLLMIALLVYALIALTRQIPETRRPDYRKSVFLMITGVGILIAYLLIELALMHPPPQWLSPASAEALRDEIHLNWDWIIILVGFATISLGIHHLFHFANPGVVDDLEEQLDRELEAERELKNVRNELEVQFMKRTMELEKSEAEATKANEIIKNTFQNMEQGIIMIKADGEVLVFNDRFLEFSNMSREEARKCRTFQDFVEHSNVGLGTESQARAINLFREGKDTSYEAVLGDGRTYEIRQTGMSDGGVVRTYTDITRYKEIETELREAVSSLESATDIMRTTLENMGQGILMVNSEGQIVTYNDKVLEYLGKDRDAVKESRTLEEFFRIGEVGETDVKRAMKYAGDGEKVIYELATRDGIVLEVRQNPLEDGGWVRTYTNITNRKKIENDLREARDQADASNMAKANFLATMSHEIRTPMNGIIGMVDLLSTHDLDTDQRHIVRTIRDSGNALLTILNDILDLSKIEAGKLELEVIEMSVTETLEGVAETLSTSAGQRGIRLVIFVDPEIPDTVIGDPVRIRQILFNLVSNAIKFSVSGSEVLVLAEPTAAAGDHGNAGTVPIRFTVTDSGIGMSEEAQRQLFQAFSQAEASTTRKYGGTGLGLSICHRLVDMMSGMISVTSREGEGSTFCVDLSFKASTRAGSEQERPLDGLRVLLAGVSTKQSQAAESYLAFAGAETDHTASADTAAAMFLDAAGGKSGYDVAVLFDDLGEDAVDKLQSAIAKRGVKSLPRVVRISSLIVQGKTFMTENGNIVRIEGNPLHRWELVKAVAIAAGRASPVVTEEYLEQAHPGEVHLPSLEQALAQGNLVLVAEDNIINQDVIRRQLNKLGYQCEIAGDGAKALAMWKKRDYGIVLSDCHMPEMDGYQLTREIRKLEREEGRKHTPIVAITANALSGEAERCLETGMDGYLSKPLKMKTLKMTLGKLMKMEADPPGLEKPAADRSHDDEKKTDPGPVIDDRSLKDEFGDDEEIFREILTDFLASAEAEFEIIKTAVKKRLPEDVVSSSHKMKSACRTVGATAMADLYEALERAGRETNWELIDKGASELDELMKGVRAYIGSL